MKKIVSIGFISIVALIIISFFLFSDNTPTVEQMNKQTALTMNLYAKNLLENEQMSEKAKEMSYEQFQEYLNDIIADWEKLEKESAELEEIATLIQKDQEKQSFHVVDTAHAYYEKEDISKIFDNAPKGRRIRTLAKELNISAKKAFQVLKMSQEQLKAESWNTAGDKFETLENGARAVKNGCKVGLYVAGNALTGGATGAVGTLAQAGAIVTNVDLVLEIGQDTASAYYGYDSNVVGVMSDIRKITEPGATFIAMSGLSIDSVGSAIETVVFTSEQLSGTIQENKVLGIEIDTKNSKATLNTIPKSQIDNWLKEKKITGNTTQKKPNTVDNDPVERITEKTTDTPENSLESLNGTVWEHDARSQGFDKVEIIFHESTATSRLYKDGEPLAPTTMSYSFKNGKGIYGRDISAMNHAAPNFEVNGDTLLMHSDKIYTYTRKK